MSNRIANICPEARLLDDWPLQSVAFDEFRYDADVREGLKNKELLVNPVFQITIDDNILGKPKSYKESFAMLKSLSGKTHQVLTGVSLIHLDLGIDFTFNEATHVSFCLLTDEEINRYIDKCKPYDKAGSYGIQDGFSVYVEKINGCFYNVMGFPIFRFHKFYKSIKMGNKLID